MIPSSEHVVLEPESPGTAQGRRVLRSYMDDVVSRYYGRQATGDEIDAAIREAPSDDLTPPHGLFLIAQGNGTVLGCVGLRFLPDRIGEVTRLFVVPAARGRGVASRLMNKLENCAREQGLATLRLDTREDLVEARRLYARRGYREVAPFNDGPYADYWFEKTLLRTKDPSGAFCTSGHVFLQKRDRIPALQAAYEVTVRRWLSR